MLGSQGLCIKNDGLDLVNVFFMIWRKKSMLPEIVQYFLIICFVFLFFLLLCIVLQTNGR